MIRNTFRRGEQPLFLLTNGTVRTYVRVTSIEGQRGRRVGSTTGSVHQPGAATLLRVVSVGRHGRRASMTLAHLIAQNPLSLGSVPAATVAGQCQG